MRPSQIPREIALREPLFGFHVLFCFVSAALFLRASAIPLLETPMTTSSLVDATTVTSSPISTSFPIIFVASAVVDCGGPLLSDICATSWTSSNFGDYSLTTDLRTVATSVRPYSQLISETVVSTVTIQMPPNSTCSDQDPLTTVLYTISTFVTRLDTTTTTVPFSTVTLTITTTSPSLVTAPKVEETNYKPQLNVTTAPPIPHGYKKRDTLATIHVQAGTANNLFRRTYDYDSCSHVPPNHDLVTNSLVDVCHFVANARQYFVSLAPVSSAAYLPSWLAYLIQVFAAIPQIASIDKVLEGDHTPSVGLLAMAKFVGKWCFAVLGLLRTVTACREVFSYVGSFDELPFVTPVLWLDWVLIYDFANRFAWKPVAYLSILVGFFIYVVCFWLCVGYGLLGYGVRQYEVLDVPQYCQHLGISWQTDPRRKHFVRLQIVIFASATLGAIVGLYILPKIKKRKMQIEFPKLPFLRKPPPLEASQVLTPIVRAFVIFPVFAGFLMSLILNRYSYLVLGQESCYASFVSSRLGYLNLYLIDWQVKFATLLGLNC